MKKYSLIRTLFFSTFVFVTTPVKSQIWSHRFQNHSSLGRDLYSANKFTQILELFSHSLWGKAFRHMGVREDFFHGHFLYSNDDELVNDQGFMQPFAILYHTQEDASTFSLSDPGGPYDYLDRKTRNWIQFIKSEDSNSYPSARTIYNAYQFMYDDYPDQEEERKSYAATLSHYTVFDHQLDYNKFPEEWRKKIIGSRQINFYTENCSTPTNKMDIYSIGRVELRNPQTGELVCLKTQASLAYIKVRTQNREKGTPIIRNNTVPHSFFDLEN